MRGALVVSAASATQSPTARGALVVPATSATTSASVHGALVVPATSATNTVPPKKQSIAEQAASRPPAFTELEVPGFERAVVSFPVTASLPQPVLISTHGAGDTPTEMCELWRGMLGDRGVVLCPAGPRMRAHEEGRYYPDHHALERITFASLQALREKYPTAVDTKRAVYAGYSQGAMMGALMIPSHGAECPRLVLVEGGFDDWSMERATTFEHAGGERALFVCGRQRCKDAALRAAAWLKNAGVDTRVVAHVGEGHVVRVAEVALPELDWLTAGDPRWTAAPTQPP